MDQLEQLKRRIAARKIQCFWRRVQPLNDTCAVTLTRLQPPIFRYYPKHDYTKRPIAYNLEAVLQNIKVSGKLVDPCTREDYDKDDFARMDALTRAYHIPFESPLATRERFLSDVETVAMAVFLGTLQPTDDALYDLLNAWLMRRFFFLVELMHDVARLDRARAAVLCGRMMSMVTGGRDSFRRFHDFFDNDVFVVYTDFIRGLLSAIGEDDVE